MNISRQVEIHKLDDAKNLVYGWASIALDADGQPVVDGEGDVIRVADLERAAHEFVKHYREANERHSGPKVGDLVQSVVTTPDVQAALGLPEGTPVGWFVAFELEPDVFAKVASGEYESFSIEGTARRVAA